jgi:hypothetical protein
MTNPAAYLASGASFWRQAGINYLQYLSICTNAARNVLKVYIRSALIYASQFELKLIMAVLTIAYCVAEIGYISNLQYFDCLLFIIHYDNNLLNYIYI